MEGSWKRRVWTLVAPETEDRSGQRLEYAAIVLASLNVIAVVFQSIASLYNSFSLFFDGFAITSVFLFTLLFVVRLWAVSTTDEDRGSGGRLRFVRRPFVFLDLVVVVGFWLGYLLVPDSLGGVRVLWFARVFDLPRFRRSRERFKRVLATQREDLGVAFSGAGMVALVSSTGMFFVERSAQPDAFGSIPDALWWGVVTLTTVGYGDVLPVTPLGRVLGGITTIAGIAFFALPSSILAAGFLADREREQEEASEADGLETAPLQAVEASSRDRCPHCGKPLDATGPADR